MESKIQSKSTYLQNKSILTDLGNRLVVAGGRWVGKGWNGSFRLAEVYIYIFLDEGSASLKEWYFSLAWGT